MDIEKETEELKQKAKNYAWNYPIPYSLYEKIEDKKEQMGEVIEQAYLAGATELQEKMKKDLVSKLKELISYSTSPSCTKEMELFIKRIENWE